MEKIDKILIGLIIMVVLLLFTSKCPVHEPFFSSRTGDICQPNEWHLKTDFGPAPPNTPPSSANCQCPDETYYQRHPTNRRQWRCLDAPTWLDPAVAAICQPNEWHRKTGAGSAPPNHPPYSANCQCPDETYYQRHPNRRQWRCLDAPVAPVAAPAVCDPMSHEEYLDAGVVVDNPSSTTVTGLGDVACAHGYDGAATVACESGTPSNPGSFIAYGCAPVLLEPVCEPMSPNEYLNAGIVVTNPSGTTVHSLGDVVCDHGYEGNATVACDHGTPSSPGRFTAYGCEHDRGWWRDDADGRWWAVPEPEEEPGNTTVSRQVNVPARQTETETNVSQGNTTVSRQVNVPARQTETNVSQGQRVEPIGSRFEPVGISTYNYANVDEYVNSTEERMPGSTGPILNNMIQPEVNQGGLLENPWESEDYSASGDFVPDTAPSPEPYPDTPERYNNELGIYNLQTTQDTDGLRGYSDQGQPDLSERGYPPEEEERGIFQAFGEGFDFFFR